MVLLEKIASTLGKGSIVLIEDTSMFGGDMLFWFLFSKVAKRWRKAIVLNTERSNEEIKRRLQSFSSCRTHVVDAVSDPFGWETTTSQSSQERLSHFAFNSLSSVTGRLTEIAKTLIEMDDSDQHANPLSKSPVPTSTNEATVRRLLGSKGTTPAEFEDKDDDVEAESADSGEVPLFVDSLHVALWPPAQDADSATLSPGIGSPPPHRVSETCRWLHKLSCEGVVSPIVVVVHSDCIADVKDLSLLEMCSTTILRVGPPMSKAPGGSVCVGCEIVHKRASGKVSRAREDCVSTGDAASFKTIPVPTAKPTAKATVAPAASSAGGAGRIQVADETKDSTKAPDKTTTPFANMDLTFNVNLTDKQRAARASAPLPYAHKGQLAAIAAQDAMFAVTAADDADPDEEVESDPDDDLDI